MANLERIKKDLETLRDISEPCESGTTRLSYTPEYRRATDYLIAEMKKAGLETHEDGIGNLYGDVAGSDPAAPKIISGSHLDTVRCSGYFDGQAGIICALEAARMLKESGKPLKSTYQVVSILMEEGARFPNLTASKFIAGVNTEDMLDTITDLDGVTLREAMKQYGLSGDISDVCRKGEPAKVFLELHMEQGLKLEAAKTDLGFVNTIYGCRWFMLTCTGETAHPSTAMDVRRDSALAAYKLISNIADIVTKDYAGRATVTSGKMNVFPGEINAIPSRAVFSLDFRSGDPKVFDELDALLESQMKVIGEQYRVGFESSLFSYSPPTPCDPNIIAALEQAADKVGCSYMPLDSGAGHDAMVLAKIWDTAMIFVPSKDGLTHSAKEWTDYENLVKGADVLYEAIRIIDETK